MPRTSSATANPAATALKLSFLVTFKIHDRHQVPPRRARRYAGAQCPPGQRATPRRQEIPARNEMVVAGSVMQAQAQSAQPPPWRGVRRDRADCRMAADVSRAACAIPSGPTQALTVSEPNVAGRHFAPTSAGAPERAVGGVVVNDRPATTWHTSGIDPRVRQHHVPDQVDLAGTGAATPGCSKPARTRNRD